MRSRIELSGTRAGINASICGNAEVIFLRVVPYKAQCHGARLLDKAKGSCTEVASENMVGGVHGEGAVHVARGDFLHQEGVHISWVDIG